MKSNAMKAASMRGSSHRRRNSGIERNKPCDQIRRYLAIYEKMPKTYFYTMVELNLHI
jgi:hypothetical protein